MVSMVHGGEAVRPLAKVPVAGVPGVQGRVGHLSRGRVTVLLPAADLMAAALGCLLFFTSWWALVVIALWPSALWARGCYRHQALPDEGFSQRPVIESGLGMLVCLEVLDVWGPVGPQVSGRLLPAAVVTVVASLCVRSVLHGAQLLARSRGVLSPRRVVLVGDTRALRRTLEELAATPTSLEVVAACVLGPGRMSTGIPLGRGRDSALGLARKHGAESFLAVPGQRLPPVALRRLAWEAEGQGMDLLLSPGLPDVVPGRTAVRRTGSVPLLQLRPAPSRGPCRLVKEVVERLAALVLLVVLSPLLLLLVILIRHDSPGPAVFRQVRLGRDERPFTIHKFRTMSTDADDRLDEVRESNEADGGVLFKIREDPRITRIGQRLRRYSLDELPQLWDVVAGNMALIGPRPPLPREAAEYDEDVRRRMAVKPGITGLWQVSGRSDLAWRDAVRLDLFYVDNWSLGLDASILFRTVGAVLRHDGAY